MNFWQTDRVRLRGVEPEDAETYWRWNQDSEMSRHLDFLWPPASLAQVRRWTEEQAQKNLENDEFHWVIENLQGAPVGSISTHHCNPRTGTFSYGIQIEQAHRRQGYARAAILLVLRYYFQELRYQKVTITVHENNPASAALHERLGFVHEGTLRRMVYSGGRYLDEHYYGMTDEEWRNLYL